MRHMRNVLAALALIAACWAAVAAAVAPVTTQADSGWNVVQPSDTGWNSAPAPTILVSDTGWN
jgi:opacity protein-like surface antigen